MFPDPRDLRDGDMFKYPLIPPDEDPSSGSSIKIQVNRRWLAFVCGACLALTREDTWQTDDDEAMTTALTRAEDLIVQLNTPIQEPPFYESDETADDEELPASPWYETISDWVIEGFLAITFTPDAAIVYSQTIPRIRLAFRSGSLGALVRVLINSVEIWSESTYSATPGSVVAELDVATFAAENELGDPPWELRIEHAGAPPGMVQRRSEVSEYKLEVELGDIRPREAAVEFRQNGCLIEVTTDGENWTTLYDPTGCINGLVDSAIIDAINAGQLDQAGGQPSPQSQPEPGACQSFHVKLRGNERWLCPFPISTGYTIEVTNVKGGWNDGTLAWYCPDGSRYLLGACSAELKGHQTGDPLADTIYHMQLIANLGGDFVGPFDTIYTVTGAYIDQDFQFQANDETLTDNQGEIEFDVEICRSAITWTHTFDFADGLQHGWGAASGWTGNFEQFGGRWGFGAPQYFGIEITLPEGSAQATLVNMAYSADIYQRDGMLFAEVGDPETCVAEKAVNHGANTIDEWCLTDGNVFRLTVNNPAGVAVHVITLSGYGDDPFVGL